MPDATVVPSQDGSELKLEHVKPAYKILDEFHHGSLTDQTEEGPIVYPSVFKIIAESKQLQEAQELFELFQSDYIPLQRCSEELLYLKSLWDMVRFRRAHCLFYWHPFIF